MDIHFLVYINSSSLMTFLLIGYQLSDLEGVDDTAFASEVASWTISSTSKFQIYTLCSSFYILGGFEVLGQNVGDYDQRNQYFERTYKDLPSHKAIYFKITFEYLDGWEANSDFVQVKFHDTLFNATQLAMIFYNNAPQVCGGGPSDATDIETVGRVFHSQSTLTLKVISQLDNRAFDESFGFRDIFLSFVANPPTSMTEEMCEMNTTNSSIGHLKTYCKCFRGQYLNTLSNTCVACHPLCNGCFGAGTNECYACAPTALFDGSKCIDCNSSKLCCTTSTGQYYICPTATTDGSLQEIFKKHLVLIRNIITACLGASLAGTVLLNAANELWSILSFQQFISYFIFINVTFPSQVNLFFAIIQPQTWNLFPNPFQALTTSLKLKFPRFSPDSENNYDPPVKFVEHGITSFFIENGGTIIALNIEIIFAYLFVSLLRMISCLKNSRLLSLIADTLRWNFIIRVFLENGAPLALAIFLQARVLIFNNSYSYLSGGLMIFASLYFVILTLCIIKVLIKKSAHELEEEALDKSFGTLYEGVKMIENSAKYYYLLIFLRGVFITLLVTYLQNIALLQILLLIFYNGYVIYYVFKCVQFKSRAVTILQRVNQILILIVELCILGLFVNIGTNPHYQILGWLIVGIIGFAMGLELLYLIVLQCIKIKTIFRRLREIGRNILQWMCEKPAKKPDRVRARTRKIRRNRIVPEISIQDK